MEKEKQRSKRKIRIFIREEVNYQISNEDRNLKNSETKGKEEIIW